MIINYPTGLYDLPEKPSDSGSVTFTISNEPPPRTNLLFPKIPPGIVDRQRNPQDLTLVERRASVGDLVFTISRSSRAEEGNAAKQYETGQVLSFGSNATKSVEPMVVNEKTETRHDLNRFDYESMGLTNEEIALIEVSSLDAHNDLADKLNGLKQARADKEVEINVQQKIINETTRNIDALNVVVANSSSTASDISDLIRKLELRRDSANIALAKAIEDANSYAAEASSVVDELRTVAVVVK